MANAPLKSPQDLALDAIIGLYNFIATRIDNKTSISRIRAILKRISNPSVVVTHKTLAIPQYLFAVGKSSLYCISKNQVIDPLVTTIKDPRLMLKKMLEDILRLRERKRAKKR